MMPSTLHLPAMSSEPPEINPYEAPQKREVPADAPPSRPPLPLALKAVAWVEIFQGLAAVGAIIHSAVMGWPNADPGYLSIPAGIFLLRLQRTWRLYLLVTSWISFVLLPLIGVATFLLEEPLDIRILNVNTKVLSDGTIALFAGTLFLIMIWQYRVLTRPEVKELFGIGRKPSDAS